MRRASDELKSCLFIKRHGVAQAVGGRRLMQGFARGSIPGHLLRHSAIHKIGAARHVARFVTRQEHRDRGDFFRGAEASPGNFADGVFESDQVVEHALIDGRCDGARGDIIDAYLVGSQFDAEIAHKHPQPAFGDGLWQRFGSAMEFAAVEIGGWQARQDTGLFPIAIDDAVESNGCMSNATLDLRVQARQAMIAAGFQPDFQADVVREVQALKQSPAKIPGPPCRDLRSLLWSSIDNDSSRDLDQVEYADKLTDGTTRLLVAIADVDSSVPKDSATDRHAVTETTSVYTGVAAFPMLPTELSTDLTSLGFGVDRLAIVIELHILESGEVGCHDIYQASIHNRAKLAYSSTGAWLEGRGPMPPVVAKVAGMEEQLRLQQESSGKLRRIRQQRGSLTFGTVEAVPVVDNGVVTNLEVVRHNVAEDIIESFMVAANVAMAEYLKEKKSLSIRRVVKTPKRWDRIRDIALPFGVALPSVPDPKALAVFLDQRKAVDPVHFPDLSLSVVKLLGAGEYIVEHPGEEHEGHFGLAVQDYTHSTAPNRRYADLITQRLLKVTAAGVPASYSEEELATIAAHCTEREDAARKVERLMRKMAAASLLSQHVGEVYDGIVTGASPKGTYVRLLKFPAEGRVVRGMQGIDVGDKVQVRLAAVDAARGFIDFERK
ncbi:MAG: rnr [Pedosphaera sp.]|nr:rnr [Pedosphaera sp.]